MMIIGLALALEALLFSVPGPQALTAAPPQAKADLILHGGSILTMLEPELSPAPSALACREGRIIYVGDDASALSLRDDGTRIVDLRGAVAVPGLFDSHVHLYGLGKALAEIDLTETRSAAECVQRVMVAARDTRELWLVGRGWDQNLWPEQAWPVRELLDEALPGRPVLLRRVDGHAAWASSEALRLAGITAATNDPPGGAILRDGRGEPTGVVIDRAVELIAALVPEPSNAEVRRRVRLAIDHCLSLGLTAVQEAGTAWDLLDLYRELATNGQLDLRLVCYLDDDPATLAAGLAHGPFATTDLMLHVPGIKLYADGALGSRGALLLQDYNDEPGNSGLQLSTTEHLRQVCEQAAATGFQVATHAIGDAANRLVLDIYEAVLGERLPAARWRIEHAQIIDPADLPRFGRLGVIASMQPIHCTSDMDWALSRLGPERLAGAYAWKTLLASGAVVCFGTDCPVEPADPRLGLHAALTRQRRDGTPAGGWRAHECLDGRTALRAYTATSARAAFLEEQLGVLAPGRLADITVLSGDPTAVAPAQILALRPLYTIVHGTIRWQAP